MWLTTRRQVYLLRAAVAVLLATAVGLGYASSTYRRQRDELREAARRQMIERCSFYRMQIDALKGVLVRNLEAPEEVFRAAARAGAPLLENLGLPSVGCLEEERFRLLAPSALREHDHPAQAVLVLITLEPVLRYRAQSSRTSDPEYIRLRDEALQQLEKIRTDEREVPP